jgi:hypothetical protein
MSEARINLRMAKNKIEWFCGAGEMRIRAVGGAGS